MNFEAVKSNRWWKQGIKYAVWAATVAGAAYAALRPEEVARQAIVEVKSSHTLLSKDVRRLQRWAQSNRERAKTAEDNCKADVSALTSFVTGYLMGLSKMNGNTRRGRQPVETVTPQSIKALVKALGKQKVRSSVKQGGSKLPKLVPPAPYQQLKMKKAGGL